jgi:hypothetical protein
MSERKNLAAKESVLVAQALLPVRFFLHARTAKSGCATRLFPQPVQTRGTIRVIKRVRAPLEARAEKGNLRLQRGGLPA